MNTPPKSPNDQLGTVPQTQPRTIVDLISQTFPAFDHRASIVSPFETESQRDAKFQEGECS